jgi:hypothetical protein
MRAGDDGVWSGPIKTRVQAEKVIAYTAGGFGLLALMSLLSAFYPSSHVNLLLGLGLGALSLALFRAKAPIVARLLFGLSAFFVLVGLCASVCGIMDSALAVAGGLAISAIWLVPLWATARACSAAKFLQTRRAILAAA